MLHQQGPICIDSECLKWIKNETFRIGIVCNKYFSSLLNYLHVKNYMGCHYWEEIGKMKEKNKTKQKTKNKLWYLNIILNSMKLSPPSKCWSVV